MHVNLTVDVLTISGYIMLVNYSPFSRPGQVASYGRFTYLFGVIREQRR